MPKAKQKGNAHKKWATLYIIIGAALLITVIHGCSKKDKNTSDTPYTPETIFCNGNDWKYIETLNIPAAHKERLKITLVRLTEESNDLNGNSQIEPGESLKPYIEYLDNFYNQPENIDFPLVFALKITNMAKNDVTQKQVQLYKIMIMKKIRDIEKKIKDKM